MRLLAIPLVQLAAGVQDKDIPRVEGARLDRHLRNSGVLPALPTATDSGKEKSSHNQEVESYQCLIPVNIYPPPSFSAFPPLPYTCYLLFTLLPPLILCNRSAFVRECSVSSRAQAHLPIEALYSSHRPILIAWHDSEEQNSARFRRELNGQVGPIVKVWP